MPSERKTRNHTTREQETGTATSDRRPTGMPPGYRGTAGRKRVPSKNPPRLHQTQVPVGSVSVHAPKFPQQSDDILGHTPSTHTWPQTSIRTTVRWQGKDDRRALGKPWHDRELTGNDLVFHILWLVEPSSNMVFESGKMPLKWHLRPFQASRLSARVQLPLLLLPPVSFLLFSPKRDDEEKEGPPCRWQKTGPVGDCQPVLRRVH